MRKPDKPLDVQKIIKNAINSILEDDKVNNNVKAILLFGSHADGTAIWRSDIDICVVFKKNLTDEQAFLFRRKILGFLPDVVDLQVFNVLPSKIKKSIAENHQILFQTSYFDDPTFIRVNLELSSEFEHKLQMLEA